MNIQDLNHLRSNSMIRFKIEEVSGVPVEIVSYMVGNKELWDDSAALETRGNVYDIKTGNCICACFPKFFNVNEREDVNEKYVEDHVVSVFEKRDGSMITPVLIDDQIYWKTKKSFFSSVALLAQSLVPKNVELFSLWCQTRQYTPIFEFTHPETRIVLEYNDEPNFTLIAIRKNDTGQFLSWWYVKSLANIFSVNTVKQYDMTWEKLMDDVESKTGIEGYVLLLGDGRRVKLKTKWYLSMHRIMTELRERDVAEAVLDETIDDMKSLVASQGKDILPIEKIEQQVTEEISEYREQVKQIVSQYSDKSIKEVAIEMKGHPLFKMIMSEKRGMDGNYIEFWKRNRLQDFSLRCIFNQNF